MPCLTKVSHKKNFDLLEIEFFSCLNVVLNNIWNGKHDKTKAESKIAVQLCLFDKDVGGFLHHMIVI